MKYFGKHLADRLGFNRALIRRTDLSEDLRLTKDHGIQAARDSEEMLHRRFTVVMVQRFFDVLARDAFGFIVRFPTGLPPGFPAAFHQEIVQQLAGRGRIRIDARIQLDSIACRQEDHFVHGGKATVRAGFRLVPVAHEQRLQIID